MKTLALVAAGSIALLGGSNAFAQCNFNAWLPANGNTGGAAISNGASVTAPTATLQVGGPAQSLARYSQRCGLRAVGPNNYVQDGSPSETATFRARFYVRATGVAGGNATVYQALNNNSPASSVFSIAFSPSNNRFVVATGTGGGTAEFGPVTAGAWYSVEVNWATTPSNSLSVAIRGNVSGAGAGTDVPVAAGANPITNFGTITGGANIETVRLGFVAGPATAGDVFVDAYESRRQNAIGLLCRGDADGQGATAGSPPALTVADRAEITQELNTFGATAARGQPDCDMNGVINVADRACVTQRLNGFDTCP